MKSNGCRSVYAYFVDPNPSAQENSRNSSFGADAFVYVRTEVKGSSSAFGSVDRDPILENARRNKPDALGHGELVAMRRETVEQRVLANGHGFDNERVPFPVPGGIAGERRIIEHSLRRLCGRLEKSGDTRRSAHRRW